MWTQPHRPQQVLVADEQPHDVGRLLRLPLLGAVRQPAGDGLVEEEVRRHDGGHGPQVHPVPLLPGDHFAEELEESLREKRRRVLVKTRDAAASVSCLHPSSSN